MLRRQIRQGFSTVVASITMAFAGLALLSAAPNAQAPLSERTASSPATVVNACHVSPIVQDLDRSAHFYHDLLGLDLVPTPASGPLPWDTDPGHLDLHGLPQS